MITDHNQPVELDLRRFQPSTEAYASVAQVWRDAWPSIAPSGPMLEHMDSSRPEWCYCLRLVATADGDVVGVGDVYSIAHQRDQNAAAIELAVKRRYRRKGIGTALYNALEAAARERSFASVTLRVRENDVIERAVKNRGFVQTTRSLMSSLDLDCFDPSRFQHTLADVRANGIRIENIESLQLEFPEWPQRLHELECKLYPDVPETGDSFTPPTFEEFREQTLNAPAFDPKGQWIAIVENQWAGLSQIITPYVGDTQRVATALTGVLPPYRRRRIAMALKVHSLANVQEQGVQTVLTGNEENNPMLNLNLVLGSTLAVRYNAQA